MHALHVLTAVSMKSVMTRKSSSVTLPALLISRRPAHQSGVSMGWHVRRKIECWGACTQALNYSLTDDCRKPRPCTRSIHQEDQPHHLLFLRL